MNWVFDKKISFEKRALRLFQIQSQKCDVYRKYLDLINVDSSQVSQIEQIPFLPIQFFKNQKILSTNSEAEIIFSSSGTSGQNASKHYVSDVSIYEESFLSAFKQFYGSVEDYRIMALLPSYLEREGSSLVYMCDQLIKKSKHPQSGFYLNNLDQLKKNLQNKTDKKTLLIGVSYALIDLVEKGAIKLQNTIVMETGGMKGKRKEMIREELHQILKDGFGLDKIHSEYGMTELLSQAYSKGDGVFESPDWMRVVARSTDDPLSVLGDNISGGLNIIDLANINSCAFIATQDLGKTLGNNQFEVLGRFDHSDVRGCNLLVQ
ncbi:acyl transferase [Flavobacteriales bacterium]|nr:acyl transferase [Flavobacteriales bacterium]